MEKKKKIIIISFVITLILLIPLIGYTFNNYKEVQKFNKQQNNNSIYQERIGLYYEIDDNDTIYVYENNSFKQAKVVN